MPYEIDLRKRKILKSFIFILCIKPQQMPQEITGHFMIIQVHTPTIVTFGKRSIFRLVFWISWNTSLNPLSSAVEPANETYGIRLFLTSPTRRINQVAGLSKDLALLFQTK